jgi:hypothetical protein
MPTFPSLVLAAWSVLLIVVAPALIRAWDCGRLLDEVLDELHLPRKVVAETMGQDERQLARAIAGVGPEHMSLDRMTRLPREVWGALLVKIAEQYRYIDPADTRAERLARVTARMVKATLRRDAREEANGASVA